MKRFTPLACAVAATTFLSFPIQAQTALPMGSTAPGLLSFGEPATFTFEATAPGFLSVVVRAEAGEDLAINILDAESQSLPDGRADIDLGGDVGAEQLVVTLPYAGRYSVLVESLSGEPASFQIGGSFLASPLAAGAEDPDGRPSGARELAVGGSFEDTIAPGEGDRWDWYRIPVTQDGVLTVLTRTPGESGDLRLELFDEGSYQNPADVSDQDMDGVLGNESITVDVTAGQVLYVRVLPSFGGTGSVAYRVACGIIPG